MDETDLREHSRKLASELLEDVELSQTTITQQVLKATRLARIVGDDKATEWLEFESVGVPNTPAGLAHMSRTSRWTDEASAKGWWGPAADYEQRILTLRQSLEASRVESFSGDMLVPVTRDHE